MHGVALRSFRPGAKTKKNWKKSRNYEKAFVRTDLQMENLSKNNTNNHKQQEQQQQQQQTTRTTTRATARTTRTTIRAIARTIRTTTRATTIKWEWGPVKSLVGAGVEGGRGGGGVLSSLWWGGGGGGSCQVFGWEYCFSPPPPTKDLTLPPPPLPPPPLRKKIFQSPHSKDFVAPLHCISPYPTTIYCISYFATTSSYHNLSSCLSLFLLYLYIVFLISLPSLIFIICNPFCPFFFENLYIMYI